MRNAIGDETALLGSENVRGGLALVSNCLAAAKEERAKDPFLRRIAVRVIGSCQRRFSMAPRPDTTGFPISSDIRSWCLNRCGRRVTVVLAPSGSAEDSPHSTLSRRNPCFPNALLFDCDILYTWLPRVSPVKSTFALVRCGWLRRTKPQFGSRRHP